MTSKVTHGFHSFSEEEAKSLSQKLLTWYDKNKRTLPWRLDKEQTSEDGPDDNAGEDQICSSSSINNNNRLEDRGYAVLVSEMMLQQTRVATVIEFYVNWMTKWPTIKDLAEANLEEVHAAWAGLGYYSRATRLLEVAKLVMEKHGGKLPQTADKLTTFPGIGRYTAGAVASIAYGQTTSVVDGNVIRVLSRLRVIGGDSASKPVVDHIWALADALLAKDYNKADDRLDASTRHSATQRPGDFNQALMELGATVCTPTSPDCQTCPLRSLCHAQTAVNKASMKSFPLIEECHLCLPLELWSSACSSSSSGVAIFPRKAPKKAAREAASLVCVVEFEGHRSQDRQSQDHQSQDRHYLMKKRPPTGLLANLWEFPTLDDPALDIVIEVKNSADHLKKIGKFALDFLRQEHKLSSSASSSSSSSTSSPSASPSSVLSRYAFVDYVGHVVHKFSHIHQTYHIVYVKVVKDDSDVDVNHNNNANDYFAVNGNDSCSKRSKANKNRENRKTVSCMVTEDTSSSDDDSTPLPTQPPSVTPQPPSFFTPDPRRSWMSEEELMSSGISTAMKKVFQHFLKNRDDKGEPKGMKSVKGGRKKRTATGGGGGRGKSKKQKTITTFFSK